jgi:hypothetical protein
MSTFRSTFKLALIALIPCVLLFYGFFIFIFSHIIKENIEQESAFKEWKPVFLLLLFLGLLIFTLKHFFKYFFNVIISEKEIIIGKRQIRYEEIRHISVREKVNYWFLFYPFTYEAAVLYLKNGEKINIGVENYANGNLIQLNLEQISNCLQDQSKPINILVKEPEKFRKKETIDYNTGVEYLRSPYLSISNYLFTGIILFIFWAVLQVKPFNKTSLFFLFFIIPFCYFFLVVQNHYFILTNNHLIIKNIFLPIKKKVFRLDEIEIIETENNLKQETALKITTKNFKIHRFQSGLMNEELFSNLIEDVNYNITKYCSEIPVSK